MEKITLYFDGVGKECQLKPSKNGEYLFEAEDGSFVKFPKDADLEKAIDKYNESNKKEVELID